MKISNKLQNLVDQGVISLEQAEKIMFSEQEKHSNLAWKLMYWIAGLFIGLGIISIIASNWDSIPASVKLFGDFIIWAGILYGAYWSIDNKKDKLKELFLTLCFLFVGATIGLIAQIFNLNGGWNSFALIWALLSFVFVVFSRLMAINILWLCLLFSSVNFGRLFKYLEYFFESSLTIGLIISSLILALLTYMGNKLYKVVNKTVLLPKAFALLTHFIMYNFVLYGGFIIGFKEVFANIFVFIFLGIRLFLTMRAKDMKSFIQNTHALELYIFLLFLSRLGGFLSGIGYISIGILLLGILYILKKTSKYIRKMEVFHE